MFGAKRVSARCSQAITALSSSLPTMATEYVNLSPTRVSKEAPAFFHCADVVLQNQSSRGELMAFAPPKVSTASQLAKAAPYDAGPRVSLNIDDLFYKVRDNDPTSVEYRLRTAMDKDPSTFHKKQGALGATFESSILVRHMLPTQVSHQRLTCLAEVLPRDVSSPDITIVSRAAPASRSKPNHHTITVQSLQDAGMLASTLSTTRPRTQLSSDQLSKSLTSLTRMEAGSVSPYRRDHWMSFVEEGKPASPAGNPLRASSPMASTSMLSPIRSRTLTASGALLTLPAGGRSPPTSLGASNSFFESTGSIADLGSTFLSTASSVEDVLGPAPTPSAATLRLDHMKLAARGLMHTRNILRQSPRHGDGKVLGPSFSESGAWATVLHPMKYKIPEAKGKANNAPSPTVDTAGGDSDQGDAAPFSPLVSNPKELEEVLKELESFEIRHGVTSSATVPRKELAAKVVRSGKYAQLGFPTPADVMAADRETLQAAYDKLKGLIVIPKKQPPVEPPLSVPREMHAPRSKLTPRSTQFLTRNAFPSQ